MGKNWAITIGINHYDNLQALGCAERDAEAIRDFFRDELGFQQSYHFAENSPPIQPDRGPQMASRPTYATLMRFLRVRFEEPFLQVGDNLWFFFAGHGLCHADRDYLMPLDADPGDVERTAIPISYVTERLRRSGADNVVLLIDACRSLSRAGPGIGSETQNGVVTLFSCSPRERSYEIEDPSIQHGVFTYALLQGLRLQGEGNCATVERLDQYLRYQVPELSRRYQKPLQTPYAVVEPASKYHLILLPRSATVRDAETLKLEAFRAEQVEDFDLAEQLWIRCWAVSPSDTDALEGVRRVDRLRATAQPGSPPPSPSRSRSIRPPAGVTPTPTPRPVLNGPASPSMPPGTTTEPGSPAMHFSRRRLMQLAGLGGVGAGGAFLFSRLLQPPTPTPSPTPMSSPPPTSTLTPTPSASEAPTGSPLALNPVEFAVVTVNAKGEQIKKENLRSGLYQEDLGGGVQLDMMGIPKGSFTMGSPNDEKQRETNEGPQHNVSLPDFLMGRYPVTQVQWRAVAGLPKIKTDLKSAPSGFKGDNRPVEQVSWEDAIEFCARLSKQTNREYRLPSEAEWEYACRAGTTTPFHFGETITTDIANYDGTSAYGSGPKGEYRKATTEVGSFKVANAFGLSDMHGNVWEWCLDYWHGNYEGAPVDGSAWVTGGESSSRVLRGGSWVSDPWHCRSAYRLGLDPGRRYDDFVGFRVVCSSAWTLS
ncbi:MAG: SUMF1/EgtB/PvdO family nonheme iron enzyme [Kovacikia sp.]